MDHIFRSLNKLVSHDLQLKLNRTGTKGKSKFPPILEEKLKGMIIVFTIAGARREGQRRSGQQGQSISDSN
jgi:hypothetical protein